MYFTTKTITAGIWRTTSMISWIIILTLNLSPSLSATQQSCHLSSQGENFHFIFLTNEPEDCYGNSSVSDLVEKATDLTKALNRRTSQFQIELQVLSVCTSSYGSVTRVARHVFNQIPDTQTCQSTGTSSEDIQLNSTLIGVIGPSDLALSEKVARSLAETEIPYISYGDFMESDPVLQAQAKTHLNNRFYTGTSLNTKAQAIAKLGVKLDWDYVTIIHDNDGTNSILIPSLLEALRREHICYKEILITAESNTTQVAARLDLNDAPHGVIIIASAQKAQRVMSSTSTNHTWITTAQPSQVLTEETRRHTVYSVSYPSADTDINIPHLYPASAAIICATEALNTTINTLCPGDLAACSSLERVQLYRNISAQLEDLSLTPTIDDVPTFLDLDRLGVLQFRNGVRLHQGRNGKDIKLYEAFNQKPDSIEVAGTFLANDGWTITPVSNTRSWCTNQDCSDTCMRQNPPRDYIYIPGDFIVVITGPVHVNTYDFPDQLTCYMFDNAFSLRAEAAIYSVRQLEKKLGLKLGLIFFDTCYNSALAQKYLIDVFNGTTDYCNNDGKCLDRKKIVALFGDYSSHVSIAEQQVSIPQNLVQLAWGASTYEFDDKTDYPMFLRIHPSQTRITENMVKFLDHTNKERITDVRSVTLLTTDSLFGITAREKMLQFLKKSSYCISHDYILNQKDNGVTDAKANSTISDDVLSDAPYVELWSTLRNHPRAIIFNGDEDPLRRFLAVLKGNSGLTDWWKESGSFFMFAEGVEDRPELLEKYGDLLVGSISFKINQTFQAEGFISHLQQDDDVNRKPKLNDDNPWFIKMYQNDQKCKYRGDFTTSYTASCVRKPYTAKRRRDILEIYNVYVIKGLYTLAYAIYDHCDGGNFANCEHILSRTQSNAEKFRETLRDTSIPSSDSLSDTQRVLRPIDNNGDGNAGYVCFQEQLDVSGKPDYFEVYQFLRNESNPSAPDKLHKDPVKNSRDVKFPNKERNGYRDSLIVECDEKKCGPDVCRVPLDPTESQPTVDGSEPNITLWIVIGILGFILLLILLYLIIRWVRKRRQRGGNMYCLSTCLQPKPTDETGPPIPFSGSLTQSHRSEDSGIPESEPPVHEDNLYEPPPSLHSNQSSIPGSHQDVTSMTTIPNSSLQGPSNSMPRYNSMGSSHNSVGQHGACNLSFEINNESAMNSDNIDYLKGIPTAEGRHEADRYQTQRYISGSSSPAQAVQQTPQPTVPVWAPLSQAPRPRPREYTRSASAGQINLPAVLSRSASRDLPEIPKFMSVDQPNLPRGMHKSASVDHHTYADNPIQGDFSRSASVDQPPWRGMFNRSASTDLPDLPECLSPADASEDRDSYLISEPSIHVGALPSGPDPIPLTMSDPQRVSTRPLTLSEEYDEII